MNEFKSFFVNVGPGLTSSFKKNDETGGNVQGGGRILLPTFIGDLSEQAILSIVRKSKTKMSVNRDGIDMMII